MDSSIKNYLSHLLLGNQFILHNNQVKTSLSHIQKREEAPEGLTKLVTPSGASFMSEQICFLCEALNCANL